MWHKTEKTEDGDAGIVDRLYEMTDCTIFIQKV